MLGVGCCWRVSWVLEGEYEMICLEREHDGGIFGLLLFSDAGER